MQQADLIPFWQLKRIGDRVVTMSKEGTLNSRRKLAGIVRSKDAQHKVFTILAERYKERAGYDPPTTSRPSCRHRPFPRITNPDTARWPGATRACCAAT